MPEHSRGRRPAKSSLSSLLKALAKIGDKSPHKFITVPQSMWDEWVDAFGKRNLELGIGSKLTPKGYTIKVITDEEAYGVSPDAPPAGEA